MRLPPIRALAFAFIAGGAVFLPMALTACVRSCSSFNLNPSNAVSPVPSDLPQPRKTGGHAALDFDPKTVRSLLFAAQSPVSGERWSARFGLSAESAHLDPGAPGDLSASLSPPPWEILSPPEDRVIGDSRANGAWIAHLFDTIKTAQFSEVPLSGTLESFGLENPRVRLRWTTEPSQNETFSYEIEIGSAAPAEAPAFGEPGFYARITQSPLETPELSAKIYTLKGAVLKMLEMISTFDSLRLSTLATFSSDEISAFEISSKAGSRENKLGGASREGGHWKLSKADSSSSGEAASAFLEKLCHLRVDRFVDDPKEAAQALPALQTKPIYRIRLKHPLGFPRGETSIRFSASEGKVFAASSDRHTGPALNAPWAVFEVGPDILGSIAVFLR